MIRISLLFTFTLALSAQQPFEGNSHIPSSKDIYEAAPRPRHAVHVRFTYNDGSPVKRFTVTRALYPNGTPEPVGSIEVQPRTPKDCDSVVYGCFVDVPYIIADPAPLIEGAVYRYYVLAVKPDGRTLVAGTNLVTIPVTDRSFELETVDRDAPRGVSARVVR